MMMFVLFFLYPPALRIHVSQPTIEILQRTDCKFEYEMRGETYLKVKMSVFIRFTACVTQVNQVEMNPEAFCSTEWWTWPPHTDAKWCVCVCVCVCMCVFRVKAQRQPTGWQERRAKTTTSQLHPQRKQTFQLLELVWGSVWMLIWTEYVELHFNSQILYQVWPIYKKLVTKIGNVLLCFLAGS